MSSHDRDAPKSSESRPAPEPGSAPGLAARASESQTPSKFRFVFHVYDYTGKVASTRVKGRDVADRLRRIAAGSNAGLIEISFHGVEVASGPFMQEIVKAARELKDRAIYSCLNDDVHHVLTLAETSTGRADV